MSEQEIQWQIHSSVEPPEWFIQQIKNHTPDLSGNYAAQLLWKRGICDAEKLAGFLDPKHYQPANPFEFNPEMQWAIERLQQARLNQEIVAIWGDFDADGITSTAVLWEGLGQFFPQNQQLFYYIPNRLSESHGLNCPGIDNLEKKGVKLIVTCDTGSTNITEIEYASQLNIDVIVTDHHTLPEQRPPVKAIINPRYFPPNHQLYNLSGVAVAYKLMEALYQTFPDIPQQPVEHLLDLVAIGLIADLVKLNGDCRYLAQKGIARLQQQSITQNSPSKITRPGISKLLELCQKNGDRPTDISFGLGPRINAISRIHGDANFCVELLTSRDQKRCQQLALETELANSRRKSLQKDVIEQVKKKLKQIDLSTTSVIVLCDQQWSIGVLGLVAGQIAQEYGRPTILLTTESSNLDIETDIKYNPSEIQIARGSARSVNEIDLYQLLFSQASLLSSFGGHPLAAGLSLPIENISLFTEAINQKLRQISLATGALMIPTVQADIVCNVRELGKDLFRELKLLEPCGMGNPTPKILIKNCWFDKVFNRNTQDLKGKEIKYIKTEFEIWDDSTSQGFPGIWWGHYQQELPIGKSDAIVELDFNPKDQGKYQIRIIAVKSNTENTQFNILNSIDWILDWRVSSPHSPIPDTIILKEHPTNWNELQIWFRKALQTNHKLAIAFPPPVNLSPVEIWEQLLGIAKFMSRTGQTATLTKIEHKLGINNHILSIGIDVLSNLGFKIKSFESEYQFSLPSHLNNLLLPHTSSAIKQFLIALKEAQFYQHYFYNVPLSTIQAIAMQTLKSNY